MARLNWKLLTAFEAVARNGTFSRAAQELNVLQPAMSRRVAALEQELGVHLLHRTRPLVTLTPEGEVLFDAVAGSLVRVQTAVEQISAPREQTTIVVDTTIGFASCYLMQRLPEFRAHHPDLVVELVSRDLSDRYQEAGADVIILFGEPDRLPGAQSAIIFGEEMVPLCAPGFLSAPVSPEQLGQHRLLHLVHGIHTRDWDRYASGTGLQVSPPGSAERFTSFMVYLQAALNGEGVMLGWEHLLQDHISGGRLIRASEHVVQTDRGYFACLSARAAQNTPAQTFLNWISRTPSDDKRSGSR